MRLVTRFRARNRSPLNDRLIFKVSDAAAIQSFSRPTTYRKALLRIAAITGPDSMARNALRSIAASYRFTKHPQAVDCELQ